ncbi:MAG: hypothetical protein OEW42_02665 [Acidimicrobiia bacterium]|nr:hypothetical protein [Acidimicrobiia bacterium]
MDSEIIAEADLMIEAPTTSARRGYDRAEVDAFVGATRSRLQTMADRLGRQQTEMARLESENRSFSRAIDIAVNAAEEVMTEAKATAANAVAEAETRSADILEIAERRATEIVAAAEAEAHERVLVAKADARDALCEERAHIDAELDLAAALLRRAADERQALDSLEAQLNGWLTGASAYLAAVAEDPVVAGRQVLDAALARVVAAEASAAIEPEIDLEESAPAAATVRSASGHTPDEMSFTCLAELDEIQAGLIDAQSEFFSAEIEDDPSRKWILG